MGVALTAMSLRRRGAARALGIACVAVSTLASIIDPRAMAQVQNDTVFSLPPASTEGTMVLETALSTRRSIRDFSPTTLTPAQVAQLVWSAQGVTDREGYRTAPSAGALYPLELHVVIGSVDGLAPGVYRYRPREHDLVHRSGEDRRAALAAAALDQDWLSDAAIAIVLTAVYERTREKYGERAERYVHMEVGHAAQNVYLQATAMGLGTTMVGAFEDERVREVLDLPRGERPLAILPVGKPR